MSSLHEDPRFAKAFFQQGALRKRELLDALKWQDIHESHGMEFDQYDTPRASYCISGESEVHGMCRLVPTDQPYMIAEIFPDMVQGKLPHRSDISEMSRLIIDQTITPGQSSRAFHEINVGGVMYNLQRGTKHIVALPYWDIAQVGLKGDGLRLEQLGDPKEIDGRMSVAVISEEITPKVVERCREFGRIKGELDLRIHRF